MCGWFTRWFLGSDWLAVAAKTPGSEVTRLSSNQPILLRVGLVIMTLGNFHNIQPPRTQIVSGNINNQLIILNIDNSSLSPNCSYQVVGDGLSSQQYSAYNLDDDEEEEEEEDEEFEADPDYSPESDEGYKTNSSVTSGSPSSFLESKGRLVTGTLSEATEDEHGNLSWLVDFKLDFLPDIDKEEDKEGDREENRGDGRGGENEEKDQPERKRARRSVETVVVESEVSGLSTTTFSLIKGPSGPSGLYQSVKPQVLPRQLSSAKPNYTYTDLITLALRDKTSLTVSEIYQWIR